MVSAANAKYTFIIIYCDLFISPYRYGWFIEGHVQGKSKCDNNAETKTALTNVEMIFTNIKL